MTPKVIWVRYKMSTQWKIIHRYGTRSTKTTVAGEHAKKPMHQSHGEYQSVLCIGFQHWDNTLLHSG